MPGRVSIGTNANALRRLLAPSSCRRKKLSSFQSSSNAATFEKAVTNNASKYQVYISTTDDPFLNLSIEHYLLQKSPVNSTILFLYINRPSVVIGRNQNPWLETNVGVLQNAVVRGLPNQQKVGENVQLVRRRSGGGAVFHDYGNVNFSVICPTADFDRDKSAEMVTRAIRKWNPRARVNERHDIVLDQGPFQGKEHQLALEDMHRSAYGSGDGGRPPLKVSGSAYKLIRQKSLHHGTCLVTSPNLESISVYLQSQARPFIKARGVESVRSPVGNIRQVDTEKTCDITTDFEYLVVDAFAAMYGISGDVLAPLRVKGQGNFIQSSGECVLGLIGDELTGVKEINLGMSELKSPTWIYEQTPQFMISSHQTDKDPRERPPLPKAFPTLLIQSQVHLQVRSGVITSSKVSISSRPNITPAMLEKMNGTLEGTNLQQISSFLGLVDKATCPEIFLETSAIFSWLDGILGKRSP